MTNNESNKKLIFISLVFIMFFWWMAYLFIGHLLGASDLNTLWKIDTNLPIAGGRKTALSIFAVNMFLIYADAVGLSFFVGILAFLSVLFSWLWLSIFLGEHFIKKLLGVIVIYSALAAPHLMTVYEINPSFKSNIQRTFNILKNKVSTQAPNFNVQNTPEQKIANVRIENFILGNAHSRNKLIIDFSFQEESSSLTVITDDTYKAEKRGEGFYKITKLIKSTGHIYSGNQQLIDVMKRNKTFTDEQIEEAFVYSDGNSLIDLEDGSLFGCYPEKNSECTKGKSFIKVEKTPDLFGECECQNYQAYDPNLNMHSYGIECTSVSKPICKIGKTTVITSHPADFVSMRTTVIPFD